MTWTRAFTTHTTASAESVWKRHVTAADWLVDDPRNKAASFASPPEVGATGTVTGATGKVKFTFTEVEPLRSMTQEFKLPGACLTLGHEFEPDAGGLRVTHTVSLDGPLAVLFIPIVGLPLARSRAEVVLACVERALAEDEATSQASVRRTAERED
ncbi:MAG: hypothetical protein JST59_19595 [Actinobacteria bacterium]|nr:hypothetical protein [Actinomycetota bacterium]